MSSSSGRGGRPGSGERLSADGRWLRSASWRKGEPLVLTQMGWFQEAVVRAETSTIRDGR